MRPTQGESPQTLLLQETLEALSALSADLKYDLVKLAVVLRDEIKALDQSRQWGGNLSNLQLLNTISTGGGPTFPTTNANSLYDLLMKPRPSGTIQVENPVIQISSPQPVPSERDAGAEETAKKK